MLGDSLTVWAKIQAYMELARPFTLLAPALGMVSGGLVGWGAESRASGEAVPWLNLANGALLAMMLNAGSNALNQIFDLEVDSVNKPERPLPSGRLSRGGAGTYAAAMYVMALFLAWLVNYQCLAIVAAGAAFTMIYSVPPIRTKRYWPLANFTIAVPRGFLLVAAGWSTAADVRSLEPWYISLIFGGFLLGAASTKDFADVTGDSAGGCRTLPVIYGPRKAALIISPFLVLPFLLFPVGAEAGVLSGLPAVLTWLGLLLAAWGAYVAYTMLKSPERLTSSRNHPSWTHMYLMMTTAQVGLIAGYAL
jgi:4-hydroxybenzoate polyprenyltransferase